MQRFTFVFLLIASSLCVNSAEAQTRCFRHDFASFRNEADTLCKNLIFTIDFSYQSGERRIAGNTEVLDSLAGHIAIPGYLWEVSIASRDGGMSRGDRLMREELIIAYLAEKNPVLSSMVVPEGKIAVDFTSYIPDTQTSVVILQLIRTHE